MENFFLFKKEIQNLQLKLKINKLVNFLDHLAEEEIKKDNNRKKKTL